MELLMQGSNSKGIQEGNVINANQCSFLEKKNTTTPIYLVKSSWCLFYEITSLVEKRNSFDVIDWDFYKDQLCAAWHVD